MGYMGSGKSTLGKAISNVTDIPFYDLDHLIVKDTDISISDFFKKHGEQLIHKNKEYEKLYKEKRYFFEEGIPKEFLKKVHK